jgi:hypothetical protein
MTLQRRSPAVLRQVANAPRSAWRTVHMDVPHRIYQNPKVIDQRIQLRDYEGVVRRCSSPTWATNNRRSC